MSAEDIIQIDSDEGENDGQTISVSVIKEKPIDLQKILGNAKKMVADGFNGSNIPTNHIGQYKNEMQNPELALPLPHRMNGLVKKRPHPQTIVANIHEQEKISEEAKKRKIEQILATYSIPVAGEVGPSTSNSNRNHQQNIRKNKTPNNSVNEVLKFCDNYLVSSERRGAHFNVTEEDFLGQFECSYQNCGKCLKDNISLMWHIWAHIVQQKPTEPLEDITNAQISEEIEEVDEEEERTDFSRLLTCPECLLTQPNPHRIQLHYHRVHKRDGFLASNSLLNCNICECVIAKKDIVDHIKEHRIVYQNGRGGEKTTLEMPYSCRFNAKKCQFRTSNRIALIEHFCSAHKGTFVVLCPFCLFTFSIPSAERKRSRVRMSDFMAHISKHDNEKTLFCNQCVTRFAKSDFQLHRTHFNLHHRPPNPTDDRKFQLPTTKALNDIKKGKSIAIGHEFVSRLCLECKMVMKDPPRDHHSQETLICPNEHCEFITNCKRAFAFHQLLGQCNPQNNPRWLFGRPKSIITTNSTNSTLAINSNSDQSQPTLKCSNCQFSTKNVQKMAEHSLQMCPKGKIRLAKFGPEELAELRIFEPNTEEEEEIIKNEKNGNADHCKKKAERPEEQQREWLAEFLPPSRVQGMAQNIKAMKYLKEESVENDEEEKEMDTVMNTLQTLRLALTSNLPSMNNKTNSTTTNVDTGKKRKRVI